MRTRMTLAIAPGTAISWAHISGTRLSPMRRAATAGNSASRSGVSVKMQLTRSPVSSPLRPISSCISVSVAARIASGSFAATVFAPRNPTKRMRARLCQPGRSVFPDLVSLRRRRSSKWVQPPPDVLPAFVAEMDVALAPPVAAALLAAVELGDTGYAEPGRLFEEFAGFARRRFGWDPNPGRMVLMPDVMTGIVELLRVLTAPGAGVVITPP